MYSADSLADAQLAWSKGWRTFRVMSGVDSITENEVLCPASKEAGYRTTCDQCKLCSGTSVKGKSVAIVAHGTGAGRIKKGGDIIAVAA